MQRYWLAASALLASSLSFVIPSEFDNFPQVVLPASNIATIDRPRLLTLDDDLDTPLPVVIWHGLGDSADAEGIQDIAGFISEIHPGTYVYIVSLADGAGDRTQSWFGDVNKQVEAVCQALADDPILSSAPAIDAVGFSQGGQFLRGYIERCGHWAPKVRSLITFGSQHNGIAEFQKCGGGLTDLLCAGANLLLKSNLVWSDFIQHEVVPAQYYRPTEDLDNYLEYSNFIADINNERPLKNITYGENLSELEKFVMVLFEDDITVIPKESGWFAEVDLETNNVTLVQDRPIYKEDWIGLKGLDERGALVFETVKGAHMQLNDKDMKRLFKKYFGPEDSVSNEVFVDEILNLEL